VSPRFIQYTCTYIRTPSSLPHTSTHPQLKKYQASSASAHYPPSNHTYYPPIDMPIVWSPENEARVCESLEVAPNIATEQQSALHSD